MDDINKYKLHRMYVYSNENIITMIIYIDNNNKYHGAYDSGSLIGFKGNVLQKFNNTYHHLSLVDNIFTIFGNINIFNNDDINIIRYHEYYKYTKDDDNKKLFINTMLNVRNKFKDTIAHDLNRIDLNLYKECYIDNTISITDIFKLLNNIFLDCEVEWKFFAFKRYIRTLHIEFDDYIYYHNNSDTNNNKKKFINFLNFFGTVTILDFIMYISRINFINSNNNIPYNNIKEFNLNIIILSLLFKIYTAESIMSEYNTISSDIDMYLYNFANNVYCEDYDNK